jgi:hypothetical protein
MQADDPAALPRLPERPPPPESPEETSQRQLAQIAGAVSALARKVDALDRPAVTSGERRAALEIAREVVSGLEEQMEPAERIKAELSVARYLTGE